MNDSTIIVEITAKGPRKSGKSTLMAIIHKAITDAGYPISAVEQYGNDDRIEKVFVTTQKTRSEWTTKLPEKK